MKNLTKPLSEGYFTLLDGMLVSGQAINLYYLRAPFEHEGPYVVVTAIYAQTDNDDDTFNSEVVVDLNVYTSFAGDFGTMDDADAITSKILELVIPSPSVSGVHAEGFNIYGAKLRAMRDYVSHLDSKNIFEKRITIEHLICQL